MAYFDVDKRTAGILTAITASAPSPGEKAAGEYIVSGIPYVTSSTGKTANAYEVPFPTLSQWIIVQNTATDATLDFGCTAAGVGGSQKYTLAASETSPKLHIRSKGIFIKPTDGKTYQVIAGLTNIPTGSIPDFTNSTHWGV